MAFNRPALSDLVTRIEGDFSARLLGGLPVLRRAVVYVLARVMAGAVHLLYGYLDWISLQAMPDTAEGAQLARWAAIWGVARKAAQAANLTVSFAGSINGTSIPAGTQLQNADGSIYFTDSDTQISAGVAQITITAQTAGTAGNVDVGSTLTLSSPIAGVSSTVTVAAKNLDGEDPEGDSSLLARLENRIQQPPMGGCQNDYVAWALQVAGVTRAWCYPNNQGLGTVGLCFVEDGNAPNIIPSAGTVTQMQSYLTDPSRKPVTAQVTAFAPVGDTLNFTIQGIASSAVQAAVQAELQDLLIRETQPGGTILLSHLNQAIQTASGVTDHVLVSPAANVVSATGHIPILGTITWL